MPWRAGPFTSQFRDSIDPHKLIKNKFKVVRDFQPFSGKLRNKEERFYTETKDDYMS